jgi:hypothetical protein
MDRTVDHPALTEEMALTIMMSVTGTADEMTGRCERKSGRSEGEGRCKNWQGKALEHVDLLRALSWKEEKQGGPVASLYFSIISCATPICRSLLEKGS